MSQATRLSRIERLSCTCSALPKISTILHGYEKWGTRARVFSQTLAQRNNKNEIRQKQKAIEINNRNRYNDKG